MVQYIVCALRFLSLIYDYDFNYVVLCLYYKNEYIVNRGREIPACMSVCVCAFLERSKHKLRASCWIFCCFFIVLKENSFFHLLVLNERRK